MKKLLLLSFTLLVFISCDELIEEIQQSLSSFDTTITGDVSTTFSGNAEFVNAIDESSSPQGSYLVIDMANENDPDEVMQLSVALVGITTGVTAGTYVYNIANPDVLVTGVYATETSEYYILDPLANNQIILTKVENTRIEGTFVLTLANVLGDKVTTTGTFNAIGVTQTI